MTLSTVERVRVRALPTLRLERARTADFEAIAVMFEALHTYNTSLDKRFALADGWRTLRHDHFMRTLAAPGALWLPAWVDEHPVGLLLMEAHGDSPLFRYRRWAELVALYVEPPYRSSGLAQRLVAEGKAWAAANGFDRVQLYVTATNDRARKFYAACGFRPVQEIWRIEVEPVSGAAQPADPSCGNRVKCGSELLESGHHHLAMETLGERRF